MPEQHQNTADLALTGVFTNYLAFRNTYLGLLITDLETNKSAETTNTLLKEFIQLDAQARLADLATPLLMLDLCRQLLIHLPQESDVDMSQLTSLLLELVKAIEHCAFESESGGDVDAEADPTSLSDTDCSVRALINQAGDLVLEYQDQPDFGMIETEFTLDPTIVEQFIIDCRGMIARMSNCLSGFISPGSGGCTLASLSGCARDLSGINELMLGAAPQAPPDEHPASSFREGVFDLSDCLREFIELPGAELAEIREPLVQIFGLLNLLLDDIQSQRITLRGRVELTTALDLLRNHVQLAAVTAAEIVSAPEPSSPDRAPDKSGPIPAESTSEQFVQVRQDRIENLSRLTSELIVSRSTISHVRNLLDQNRPPAELAEALDNAERTFGQALAELENSVIDIRMRRLGELFDRFPRLVRNLAKEQNKSIRLKLSGEETELDNTILLAIADPLLHLVNNACDHGFEPEAERIAAGKPPTGTLTLAGYLTGKEVVIEISDDGRGLDPALIRDRALEKGLIDPQIATTMTDDEIRDLIFTPAFSTAREVTAISGRGVGMDVVKHNLTRINGHVTLESRTGEYSCFRLFVPVTLSISRGLIVVANDARYFIPLEQVVSMLGLDQAALHTHLNQRLLRLPDGTVPFLHLSELLDSTAPVPTASDTQTEVVVLDIDHTRLAIGIDHIIDIDDMAIRPLPGKLEQLDLYLGCSILADGNVVPVLNPRKLLSSQPALTDLAGRFSS